MLRPLVATALVAPLLFAPLATRADSDKPASPGDVAASIREAEKAVRDGDPRAAVTRLESALGNAPASDRPAILDALRTAYPDAAAQAQAESHPREAAGYRENLAILELRAAKTSKSAITSEPVNPPAPDVNKSISSNQSISPPLAPSTGELDPPSPAVRVPEPLPAPDSLGFGPESRFAALESNLGPATDRPEPAPAKTDPAAAPSPESVVEEGLELPRSDADPRPSPDVAPTDDRTALASSIRVEPGTSGPPDGLESPAPSAPTGSGREAAEPDPVGDALAKADAAFGAKSFDEAGSRYRDLAAAGKLPVDRRPLWAYCRRVAVVRRINRATGDPNEWAALASEVSAISAMTPNHWYDEYLSRVIAERASAPRRGSAGRSRSQGTVIRGASPEEPAPRPADRNQPQPRPTASTVGPAEAKVKPVGDVPYWSSWQIHESENFRIYHANPDLARRVAKAAEIARGASIERWTGASAAGNWSPVCEIYLYPDAKVYGERTGQPEDSPGFSTAGLMAGRVTARRINLRADHPALVEAILPHEVTHIVMADLFPDLQVPRWADEGMAVLAEPADEQARRARDLDAPLGGGGPVFGVDQLMVMDYPEGEHWPLYYAQSISLTKFLVERGTPPRFVAFVRASQTEGPDAALRRHYGIEGAKDLQSLWIAHARSEVDPAVRTASLPEKSTTAIR